ncbi:pentapeptide repeat-containing protein [Campylobacter jejuni]|uniref:pentapeptide repeat-containing protein n=1 Tax=Campylobacter jejuni TaxID=197 RepID=UPI001EE0197A|nr:pentapeptide repeat-containing protein [Campylobacter jejuni]EKI4448528.1 pentapeptide repeat-containing protein [Campylobacter jejuni]EKQ3765684.1 pentapeptide repeat-containing protein [Campylobacter jejuni]MCC3025824.1 pentapeptide repeat-containing protein [Campylobacter jejuni]MCG4237915.1 pentapeptide repeat-containing protein [Campylobacter jejuni]HEP7855743.1 pentapeptide repeat-containing protein [Campylobacter jejuni]
MKYKWIVKNAYIDFKLNNLYMLINPSDKIYLEEDVCYCFEIYIKYRIFNNCILVCDMLDNWWKLISSTLHLDKSHIKYNYLLNTFIVSDFELGIKLESNLLTKFNFEFYNGLILNQLSITNGLSLKIENYNKSLKFSNCKFNKEFCIARINISKQIVFENIYFLENVFIKWVNFNENLCLRFFKCNFKKQCNFKYNIFYNEIDFLDIYAKELILEQNIFNKFLYIQNSTINNINLWKNKFKNRCYFVDSKFGYKDKDNTTKLNFSNTHFEDNAYFNNSHFKDYADFHECEFEKIACFYGVRFDKAPNFSQAIFKGNLNAVNANLNFTFDNLQERIKQEYEDFNKNIENKKSLDKFANDFRDSFRTFKNALIKDNNLLDASNFHKYELYCKELELKNKKGKTFKDVVDRWQLLFYRKLCDHHTDILQSLNSLILVIGIFVISSVAMVVGFNYSLGYKPILEHWYFSLDFYNHHINSIIQDNYLFVATVNLVMLFGYLILVGFALCLKYMREFFIIISYVITLLVLAISPKILIPAMGIFTDKRAMLDPLSVFGGIYTIIFGFVAFSFIKTIRKNSIVPS